jgi:hypothetical protein
MVPETFTQDLPKDGDNSDDTDYNEDEEEECRVCRGPAEDQ